MRLAGRSNLVAGKCQAHPGPRTQVPSPLSSPHRLRPEDFTGDLVIETEPDSEDALLWENAHVIKDLEVISGAEIIYLFSVPETRKTLKN